MTVLKKRLRVGLGVGLKDDSGERILNALEFINDVVWCIEQSRVDIVKTGTNESVSNE